MKKIDLELKILQLEERNKYLESEFKWLWNVFKRAVKEKRTDKVPDIINDGILRILK